MRNHSLVNLSPMLFYIWSLFNTYSTHFFKFITFLKKNPVVKISTSSWQLHPSLPFCFPSNQLEIKKTFYLLGSSLKAWPMKRWSSRRATIHFIVITLYQQHHFLLINYANLHNFINKFRRKADKKNCCTNYYIRS